MSNTALLESMNAMPMAWIEECENDVLPKKPNVWKVGAAAAACACVAMGALFACGAFQRQPTVVTPENSIGTFMSASLARGPYPGEMWYSIWLGSDINNRKSTDNLVYCVEIIFSTEQEHINMNREKTKAECERLAALGYELYIEEKDWIGYWGEPKHYTTVGGFLSVEQMEALREVSQYGCYIDFAMSSFEEYTRVEP